MPKREEHHTHRVYATRDTGKHKAGETVGYYSSGSRASTARDKHDNAYGAYAYRREPLFMTDSNKEPDEKAD